MRTHFEAWCLAWKQIGLAHALGMYEASVAWRRAQRDALIFGTGHVRFEADEEGRLLPSLILRYANLQVTAPRAAYFDGLGLVESLK